MSELVIQRAFGSGELAPAVAARADLATYTTGLRVLRNMLVQRAGGVCNRPGLRFIAACKTASPAVQLLRYVSEQIGESVLIEAGVHYLRFFQDGAPLRVSGVPAWDVATAYVAGDLVTDGGVTYYATGPSLGAAPPGATWYALADDLYEIPSPFGTHGLFNWVQSGRVITMTHPEEPPHELHYQGPTRWVIRPVVTEPAIPAPTGVAVTAGAVGTRTFGYVVTAAAAETYEESHPSAVATVASAAEPTKDAPHDVTWTAVPGAVEYYVYGDPFENGVHGYLGTTTETTFHDAGFVPDFSVTPPIPRPLFTTPRDYPAHAAYYQQRRWFAYTTNEPDGIWASRIGFPSNFTISSPLQDDDALTLRLAGNTFHPVRHLVALKSLIVMTDGGEWMLGDGSQPLTPTYLPADQFVYVGSHDKRPVVVGNTILYIQVRGSVLREIRFAQQVDGLAGRDLTRWATHLVDGQRLARIDYAQVPHSIVWAARGNDTLLGLTYLPEDDLWGWSRHDSAGAAFDDVCVVPEDTEDGVYVIVARPIGGATVRYIERFASRLIDVDHVEEQAFFVDSGLSYHGAPTTTVSGLDHLEDEVVAVVADGAVVFAGDPAHADAESYRVTGGTITLPTAASDIHIGLRYVAELETLDLDAGGAAVRGQVKRVQGLSVLLEASARTFLAGPDPAHLLPFHVKPFESTDVVFTGQVEMHLTGAFTKDGRVRLRQPDPLPLTVLGVLPYVDLGG